jgi:hypothetical protein
VKEVDEDDSETVPLLRMGLHLSITFLPLARVLEEDIDYALIGVSNIDADVKLMHLCLLIRSLSETLSYSHINSA